MARLVVFFSLSFAILFLAATGLRFMAIRIDWVKSFSQEPVSVLTDIIAAARWALSLGLYGGILLGLSYIARERINAPMAILCVGLLGLGLFSGISYGLDSWENVPPEQAPVQLLGGPGLILGNSERPSSTVFILLQGPGEPSDPRVVSMYDRPLQYQPEFSGRNAANLPQVPLGSENPWFLRSIAIDLRLNAEHLHGLFTEGYIPFLIYAGSLVFLLCSLLCILKFSAWPLTSFLLGCLAFRGILAMEVFFNSPEMQDVISSFLQGRLPLSLAVPLIFCAIGILAYIYTILVFLAKRQASYAE